MNHFLFNVVLVIFALCSSTRAAPATSDNDDLQETITSLQEITKSHQHEIEALKAVVSTERKRVQLVESENAKLNKALINAVGSWADDKQMTADSMFLATISAESVSISSGDSVILDTAPINPGGHFNTILGMYEAPVNGYYQFSANKEGDQSQGSFYFLIDTVRYAYTDVFFGNVNGSPSGSATINIELTAGQVVRIENIGSTTIYGTASTGYMHSWFTGHLLYAL